MTKLIWLLDWMLEDEKSRPSEQELAWRASCVRRAKKVALIVCAPFAVWGLGEFVAKQTARHEEASASVLWAGDDSYDSGSPGVGMHASSSHRVERDGVRLLIDGVPEPVQYSTGPGSGLRKLSAGERVRVQYRRGTFLFWDSVAVTKVSELAEPTDLHGT